jgi:hypothetical protein
MVPADLGSIGPFNNGDVDAAYARRAYKRSSSGAASARRAAS